MKNVLEYLELSAERLSDKTAVRDPESRYTFQELAGCARRIGSALISGSGGGSAVRCRPVVVYMEKGAEALASFLGIVYAGGFYTFISPEQPPARIRQILNVLRVDRVICRKEAGDPKEAGGPERLREAGFSGELLYFEDLSAHPERSGLLEEVREKAQDIDPLYCNFTSGSTGVPKGVLISHRSVIDFMNHFPGMFGITERDVIGNQAPFDFDVSVKDIYSSLKTGASLVIIPKKLFSIPARLLDYLCEYEVTTLIWAVSALCIITQLKGFSYRVPEKVNKVLFSGEAMPVKHLNQWREALPDAEFVNLYGPTEITCNCTYYRVLREFAPDEKLPIGRPFPNEKVFLLDIGKERKDSGSGGDCAGSGEICSDERRTGGSCAGGDTDEGHTEGCANENRAGGGGLDEGRAGEREIVEPGQIGEICVSGTALGLGYYNSPQQTAKVFVQNPLNSSYQERIYRTGDLGYFDGDGNLCFAGRKDFQIKHMGHRIELEEIERIIGSYPGVERVCCVFDDVKKKVIAYYSGGPESREIRSRMREAVPAYMIPQVFREAEVLPMNANGKIDRKRLLAEYRSETQNAQGVRGVQSTQGVQGTQGVQSVQGAKNRG